MIIDQEFLKSAGAEIKYYDTDETIFYEDNLPLYYYQIVEGEVKLNNYSSEGKEFIQNILSAGQSVGESLLFGDKRYPMNAISVTPSTVLRMNKNDFFAMLDDHPYLYRDLCKGLSDRLYYKYIMLQKNSLENPEERLKGVMSYLKSFHSSSDIFSFEIPLTRQQLASLTGLRVETVIRTIKNMEKENVLKIKNRKILY
ncbi:Crp/Fnr family transcriptional regulator [Chryseobacterium oranimense]|uniref:cAMP-binding domain of CRP or a regulatory subunit of cAMP-dependent protein kinases n=1 Tax=Chryseobacterium oranimense TaxID=421058 RepID=A0A1M5UNJ1_9FLAO|nr:Crp/Fnr family transcriptional regulator [Chryseobacterium oranimense]CEJ70153.1 Nitrogen fixation regulation protein FixK [Chryseobacterium oranimense G311]SHH64418.1 cAMP-binding domain of CRP or a regulatory subunit of cAMP-dependent protein kinases [Chryseobacterium oranimense]